MKGTLELRNPIKINNVLVSSMDYDTEEITAEMFANADSAKQKIAGHNGSMATVFEVDASLHMYLGMMAIIAVNPGYDLKDLENIKGYDVVGLSRVGRNFIIGKSEEPLPLNDSAGSSGTMPKDSTPLLEISENTD